MDLFLIILAGIWLIFASISDLKKREVPNWLSFSLIAFALAYKAVYAVLNNNLMFFIYGALGLLVFVALGYGFYYSRIFGGGDAKLLMGLGIILSSNNFSSNLMIYGLFVFLFLLSGSIYSFFYSFFLVIKNRKSFSEEFYKQIKQRKILIFISIFLALLSLLVPVLMKENLLFYLSLIIVVFPFLFVYAKAVEESCMIQIVSGRDVTVGDWLYEPVKIGKKIIKPYWEGLTENEVELLKNQKKIKIKQGIPFVPAFLIGFVLLIIFQNYFMNLLSLFF